MHLGLIGFGNIGRALCAVLAQENAMPARVSVLTRAHAGGALDGLGFDAVTEARALVAARPDLVIECAGQRAVAAHVPACLEAGIDVVLASGGALADDVLHARLNAAARAGGARMIIPAGALGAVDLLAALRPSGIDSVRYRGRKPPQAWAGTPAEALLDLSALREPATFFTGSAREAALQYPKNANVTATLALAGLGFDATEVELVADPTISCNMHEVTVCAGAADYFIQIEGKPSPDNPKTSATTTFSLAREVINCHRTTAI